MNPPAYNHQPHTLHLFNPEHDICLAANIPHFTAPRAGRQLRHDLGFLPTLWASNNDLILVDDVEQAMQTSKAVTLPHHGTMIDKAGLRQRLKADRACIDSISPWGWDLTIRQELMECDVPAVLLPSDRQLEVIRQMSHRAWAARHLLEPLQAIEGTTGCSWQATSMEQCRELLGNNAPMILKAPWSSSGRGVRQTSGQTEKVTAQLQGWIRHVIQQQGSIMVEPLYNKVCDCGIELYSDGRGNVEYRGLSLFTTTNGAYTGNVIDNEDSKQQRLFQLVSKKTFTEVVNQAVCILGPALEGVYEGPLGIDMMIVEQDGLRLLHPCVEMNLRATMGHVALALNASADSLPTTMRITYDGSYHFVI